MHRHEAAAVGVAVAVNRRPFYIVNDANHKCLEIHGGANHPGSQVVAFSRRAARAEHQLWYLDPQGVIHSMVKDMVLDCRRVEDQLVVNPHHPGDVSQMWMLEGNRIVNRTHPEECVQIRLGQDRDNADIILHRYDRSPYQHWRFDFV
jgi:hypothetical protein